MTRSKWKSPYVDLSIVNTIKKKNIKNKIIYTTSRNTIIIKKFIGSTFFVHKGNKFIKVVIHKDMLGYKLGEFAFTRAVGKIHKVIKRKKK